ncbi:MAG TPA: DUF177 domain-containing protein [Vicinamibacterales bacterium]|nr:DUF177 domain-containing protein [Vicinamibacterales bacterium]
MLLDLRGFRGWVDQVSRTFEPSHFDLTGEDFRVAAPVVLAAEVRKDAQKVRLVGRVATSLEMACGRCLEPFAIPVDAGFDLLFLPQTDDGPADEREVQDSDVGVTFYKDDVIDLGEVMREQFLLALPMKPLCRPDCKGLCPVCGINRNRETCECKEEWVDPRLAVLKKLIK